MTIGCSGADAPDGYSPLTRSLPCRAFPVKRHFRTACRGGTLLRMTEDEKDGPTAPLALAIVNARVWTGDPRRPWADAVLVRDGRIEGVGSSAEIRKRLAGTERVVDGKSRMVMPATANGTIAAGAPADLVLVDGASDRVSPETMRDAEVLLTIVGGEVRFDRDALAG